MTYNVVSRSNAAKIALFVVKAQEARAVSTRCLDFDDGRCDFFYALGPVHQQHRVFGIAASLAGPLNSARPQTGRADMTAPFIVALRMLTSSVRMRLLPVAFGLTWLVLWWWGAGNRAIVVGVHDLAPGTVLNRDDVMTLVLSWRQPLPDGAFKSYVWPDCRGRVIGHKVVHSVEKYQPLTVNDIN